jgi:hypothetical protein
MERRALRSSACVKRVRDLESPRIEGGRAKPDFHGPASVRRVGVVCGVYVRTDR